MSRRFDLVVFDVGGVLIRLAPSWEDAHRRAGLDGEPLSDDEWDPRWIPIDHELETGAIDHEEFCRRIAAVSGGVYSADDIDRVSEAWLIEQHLGIEDVFDSLETASVETAVLSNTAPPHWARLLNSNAAAEPEFPAVLRARHHFASYLIGAIKPCAAAYEAVVVGTGHPAGRILFFDDREANVDGARAVGWAAELIDRTGDPAAQMLACLRQRGVVV